MELNPINFRLLGRLGGKRLTGQWLSGEAETTVDVKGRVVVSQQLRKGFGNTVSVLYWAKDRLMLMPPENFDKLVDKLAPNLSLDSSEGVKNFFNSKNRQDRRFFFGKKVDLEFDPQGRLTIPKSLRDDKDLYPTVDVVLVGCGDYVELLAKKHYLADCARWEAAGGYENLFSDTPPLPDPLSWPEPADGSDA